VRFVLCQYMFQKCHKFNDVIQFFLKLLKQYLTKIKDKKLKDIKTL